MSGSPRSWGQGAWSCWAPAAVGGGTVECGDSCQWAVRVGCRLESQGKAPLLLPENPAIASVSVDGGDCARIRVGVPSLIVFLRGQSCLGQCHLMNGRLRSHPHWGESSEVWGRSSELRSRGSPVCTLWQTSVKVERIKDFPENPAW